MNNEILNLLTDIFEVCIIPLLGVLTFYLVNFIKVKSKDLSNKINDDKANKYIEMLADTISACVIATNQTYVEALKNKNAFTAEAQKEAFNMTLNAVMAVLTEDAKDYLRSIYGDLDTYITAQIEAQVNLSK